MKHRPLYKSLLFLSTFLFVFCFSAPAMAEEAQASPLEFIEQENAHYYAGDEITLILNAIEDSSADISITDANDNIIYQSEEPVSLKSGENEVALTAPEQIGEYTVHAASGTIEALIPISIENKPAEASAVSEAPSASPSVALESIAPLPSEETVPVDSETPAESETASPSAEASADAEESDASPAVYSSRAATLTLTGYTAPSSVKQGGVFSLKGTIKSTEAFTSVRVAIEDVTSGDYEIDVKKSVSSTTSYSMSKIDGSVKFSTLAAGTKRIYIQVKLSGSSSYTNVVSPTEFSVTSSTKQSITISGDTTAEYGETINWKVKIGKKTKVYLIVETQDGKLAFYGKNNSCSAKTYSLAWGMGVTADNELGRSSGDKLPVGSYVFKVISEGIVKTHNFTVTNSTLNVSISGYTPPTTLKRGASYSLKGTLTSNKAIKTVRVLIKDASSNSEIDVSKSAGSVKTYSLSNIDGSVKFGTLTSGKKTISIIVTTTSGVVYTVSHADFEVTDSGTSSAATYTLSSFSAPGTLTKGSSYSLTGTIKCTKNLESVKVYAKDTTDYDTVASASATNINSTSYSLSNLASKFKLDNLDEGSYIMYITATASGEDAATVKTSAFTVVSAAAVTLTGYTPPTSITMGKSYSFSGTLKSGSPMTKVRGVVTDVSTGKTEIDVSHTASSVTSQSLSKLNGLVKFGTLTTGTKKFAIIVTTSAGTVTVREDEFKVVSAAAVTLTGYTPPTSITKGKSYSFSGTLKSGSPITKVRGVVTDVSTGKTEIDVSHTASSVTSQSLSKLNGLVKFGTLSTGTKKFAIIVTTSAGTVTVREDEFKVV